MTRESLYNIIFGREKYQYVEPKHSKEVLKTIGNTKNLSACVRRPRMPIEALEGYLGNRSKE